MSMRWVACCTGAWLTVAAAAMAATREMSVIVEKGQVRAAPGTLSKVVDTLEYKTVVGILEQQGTWYKVATKDGKVTGWMAATSLTKGTSLKAGGDVTGGASAEEISNAGKGFTEQVEKAYRDKNPKVDFAWVDKMLGYKVTPEEIVSFLKQGGIETQKGGKP